MNRRTQPVKHLIVHHSESPGGDREFIRCVHVNNNGWADIGYHYIICNGRKHGEWKAGRDGEVQEGRPLEYVGAHARGANSDSVGVCLIGDFQYTYPTAMQIKSLIVLLANLCIAYGLDPHKAIIGHRDVNATECPGKLFYPSLEAIRWGVAGRVKILEAGE